MSWDGTAWQDKAACAPYVEEGSDFWFSPEYERKDEERRRVKQAKDICHDCPVMAACALEGMNHLTRHGWLDEGIYGGLTGDERRRTWKDIRARLSFVKTMEARKKAAA